MTHEFSFRAQVAAEAIEKVGRLFNASIDDILNELLQNARRAGATKVLIDQVFGKTVRIIDDGAGLDDPRSLFSLGRSRWTEQLSRSEDAAGMGFFALANRGATVIAQRKDTRQSWFIEATPDAFHGRQPVKVSSGPSEHKGVLIYFPEGKSENLATAVHRAAHFYPLPVVFNGEEIPRSDFLKDADHVEEWRGIRIGIFDRHATGRYLGNANFHGVTLRLPLPALAQTWHRFFEARIDVVDCAHLKLVLPARKEVVQDKMFHALLDEVERIFFRMIAAAGSHSLSFGDYQRGRALGIDLPEATPALRPFLPSFAESDRNNYRSGERLAPDAHVYEGGDPLEEQNLARAFSRWNDAPPIYESNCVFGGYGWYDSLPGITLKSYRMMCGDVVEEIEPGVSFKHDGRPESLEAVLDVNDREGAQIRHLATDLIVAGPKYGALGEMDIHVTSQSTIIPSDLRRFLIDALFSPSDDAEAGSYDQQLEWFVDEAEDISICLLQSDGAAELNAIVRTVEREVVWRLPETGSVVIRIDDRKVSIEGLPGATVTVAEPHSIDAAL